jgi:multidrug efflux system membrane fusion protein
MIPFALRRQSCGRPGALPATALLVMLLAAGLLSACSPGAANDAKASAAKVPVTVADVMKKTVPFNVEGIGNVEAIASVAIKSRIDGQILKLGFHDGADVRQGQMLFEIDPRPSLSLLKQAEARLASDVAQLERARDQDARYKDLLQKHFISPDYYNQIRATFDSARAAVDADRAAVDNARLQVEYCTLRAPISGRAGRILVQQGNLVKANDVSPLATINQLSPIFVNFAVPERFLPQIRDAMKAGVSAVKVIAQASDAGQVQAEGRLSFVDNTVDMSTGTIRLRATVVNRDAPLWPGQFVRAVLTMGAQQDAIVVPADAVQIGPKGNYVYVVDDAAKAQIREVTTGRAIGRETVIAAGLKGGEKVVVDGQSRLVPGAAVDIRPSGKPS